MRIVFLNFSVIHPIWVKFVLGVTLCEEQHRMSMKWLWLFFLLTQLTDQWQIFLTSVFFFIPFWLNLVFGLILGKKYHTEEPCYKAPTYKAMPVYKAFQINSWINITTFGIRYLLFVYSVFGIRYSSFLTILRPLIIRYKYHRVGNSWTFS